MTDRSREYKYRIGLLGGTFDPIHNAHLLLGEAAYGQFGLDAVWFMPSHVPPFKKDKSGLTDEDMRFAMAELAVADNPHFSVCTIERNREEISYTYRTLELLREAYPDTWFFFIMGADCLAEFPTWYRPERIAEICTILAAMRGEEEEAYAADLENVRHAFDADVRPLTMIRADISSSLIRGRYAEGKSVKYLVPDTVDRYVREHGLYKEASLTEEAAMRNADQPDPGKLRWQAAGHLADRIENDLTKLLKPSRMRHTHGVAYTAESLAMAYGEDPQRAFLAGMLHDIAKYLTNEDLVSFCRAHSIEITDDEYAAPYLLHAKAGAKMSEDRYCVRDPEILRAIRFHTTGRPGMSLLEKIIFTADYIEPGRHHSEALPELRKMAFRDLDGCICRILRDTLTYLSDAGKPIDKTTREAYDYYRNNH